MATNELAALKASFNRAKAFLNAGDAKMAEKICRSGLKQITSGDPNLQVLLCVAMIRQGRSGAAVKRLKHALRMFPDFPQAHEELGNAFLGQNKPEKAIESFQKAIELDPNNASARIKLGKIFSALGRRQEADEAYKEALKLDPMQEKLASAAQLLRQNKVEEAERICRQALREQPDDVNGLRLLASIASQLEQKDDAIVLLERAVELKPKFSGAWSDLAEAYSDTDEFGKALDAVQRVIKLQPDLPFGFMVRAGILTKSGDHQGGLEAYEEALKIEPDHVGSNMGIGNVLKTVGRFDESVEAYKKCIKTQPLFAEAYWSLANLKTYQFEASEIEQMEHHVKNEMMLEEHKAFFHIALANAKEKEKKFDAAWQHFMDGNTMRRSGEIYDAVQTQVSHDELIDTFTEDFIKAKKDLVGHQSNAPIFIVGLPRSGSTLVEQILASHSLVEGTKELPDLPLLGRKLSKSRGRGIKYPSAVTTMTDAEFVEFGESYLTTTQRYRTGKPHFIDKMPNNFASLGFLKLILPNATVINAKRHPLDCCISCFKQLFYKGQSWSYDLFEIGEYYLEYDRMMKHWHTVLPNEIHDLEYAEMINDQENVTRRLLNFCQLDWEEKCLRFYETKRSINTASSEQVRLPIYKGALNSWRLYEEHIGPLIEILEPILLELPKEDRPKLLQ